MVEPLQNLTVMLDPLSTNSEPQNVRKSEEKSLVVEIETMQTENMEVDVVSVEEPGTPKANIELSMELKKVIDEKNILTSKTKAKVFGDLDEIKKSSDEENRQSKKSKALSEIVESEKSYVGQLEKIINFFIEPVQEKEMLPEDKFEILFGNIKPIYNLNKELLEEITKDNDSVIKAFNKILPFFKMYSVYAFEYKNILEILKESKGNYAQFSKFVDDQESRPEVQNKLSALLITPIQRVPRYKLLLEQLFQLTDESEEDYATLQECIKKINEVAQHLDNVIADSENQRKLLEYQRCVSNNNPNIITPGRRIVKQGYLTKMTTPSSPGQKMYIVLMNDIIIFNKIKKERLVTNSLKVASIFPLNKCKISEISDKGCLNIESGNESLFLYHKESEKTKKWYQMITKTITKYMADRKSLRKESSARRPVKRKEVNEYNEVGLSPGQPLKKRKIIEEKPLEKSVSSPNTSLRRLVHMRPPIRAALFDPVLSHTSKTSNFSKQTSNNQGGHGSDRNEVMDVEGDHRDDSRVDEVNKNNEVFIFGRQQNDKQNVGTIRTFLGGINSVIKRFLGIRS